MKIFRIKCLDVFRIKLIKHERCHILLQSFQLIFLYLKRYKIYHEDTWEEIDEAKRNKNVDWITILRFISLFTFDVGLLFEILQTTSGKCSQLKFCNVAWA